jgi:hypothetical protein
MRRRADYATLQPAYATGLPNGQEGRHHLDPSILQRAVQTAVTRSGLPKRVSWDTFRHSFGGQVDPKAGSGPMLLLDGSNDWR